MFRFIRNQGHRGIPGHFRMTDKDILFREADIQSFDLIGIGLPLFICFCGHGLGKERSVCRIYSLFYLRARRNFARGITRGKQWGDGRGAFVLSYCSGFYRQALFPGAGVARSSSTIRRTYKLRFHSYLLVAVFISATVACRPLILTERRCGALRCLQPQNSSAVMRFLPSLHRAR